ncbi:hypothetical protein WISP_113883 [Willisornis vidua]|uniref:Uncharacterized protein n=1 Tax=Willisornis vidua TaxID=1566151 RepID=A0ABQ9D0T0_9PASS|nr:hypothetical protein WISP_113883 [Willisornis vidua]
MNSRFKSYIGNRMINFLMNFSVAVITMVSGRFKNANKFIDAVVDKNKMMELFSLETKCKKLKFDTGRPKVQPPLLMGSAVVSVESVLEPAVIGSAGHRGSFWQLLTQGPPVANPIHLSNYTLPIVPSTSQEDRKDGIKSKKDRMKYIQTNSTVLRILKELADVITKPLLMIFEQSWEYREVQADRKLMKIVLIFKQTKKEDHGNYGPTQIIKYEKTQIITYDITQNPGLSSAFFVSKKKREAEAAISVAEVVVKIEGASIWVMVAMTKTA